MKPVNFNRITHFYRILFLVIDFLVTVYIGSHSLISHFDNRTFNTLSKTSLQWWPDILWYAFVCTQKNVAVPEFRLCRFGGSNWSSVSTVSTSFSYMPFRHNSLAWDNEWTSPLTNTTKSKEFMCSMNFDTNVFLHAFLHLFVFSQNNSWFILSLQ